MCDCDKDKFVVITPMFLARYTDRSKEMRFILNDTVDDTLFVVEGIDDAIHYTNTTMPEIEVVPVPSWYTGNERTSKAVEVMRSTFTGREVPINDAVSKVVLADIISSVTKGKEPLGKYLASYVVSINTDTGEIDYDSARVWLRSDKPCGWYYDSTISLVVPSEVGVFIRPSETDNILYRIEEPVTVSISYKALVEVLGEDTTRSLATSIGAANLRYKHMETGEYHEEW